MISPIHYAPLFGAAVAMGFAIGFERYKRNKVASPNVYTLTCLAACVLVRSVILFAPNASNLFTIPAASITGLGFAAAALIMRRGNIAEGVTSAVMLMVVDAIGIADGFGQWELALTVTALVLVTVVATCKLCPDREGDEPSAPTATSGQDQQ